MLYIRNAAWKVWRLLSAVLNLWSGTSVPYGTFHIKIWSNNLLIRHLIPCHLFPAQKHHKAGHRKEQQLGNCVKIPSISRMGGSGSLKVLGSLTFSILTFAAAMSRKYIFSIMLVLNIIIHFLPFYKKWPTTLRYLSKWSNISMGFLPIYSHQCWYDGHSSH